MKMKKIVLGMATALAVLSLAGCKNQDTGADSGKNEGSDSKGTMTIGVLQQVEHGSLDAAYAGFQEGLEEEGLTDVKLDYQNAQGAQDQLKTMSQKLVKEKVDLLLGIATPAAQALLNETTDIPIVVTAVTDLVEAQLVESNETPGGNLTGTSDMVPIEKQIDLLLSVIDNPEKIGIMYNAGEANSLLQANLAKEYLESKNIKVKELTATSTNDVQQVTNSLAKDVDGIYIPTDNTFASAMPVVKKVTEETKTPVVAGSVEMVQDGGLATFGIDYHSLGKQTAKIAAKILKGDAKPGDIPVETSDDLKLEINKEVAEAIGIDPDKIVAPE